MKLIERLNQLKEEQQQVIKKMETVIKETESSPLLNEKEKMTEELERLKNKLEELNKERDKLLKDNGVLRESLYQQVMDEKLNILKISEKRQALYFQNLEKEGENRLKQLENETAVRIGKMRRTAEKELLEEKAAFLQELDALEKSLGDRVLVAREKGQKEGQQIWQDFKEGISLFSREQISDGDIRKRLKQNKIEMNIGLRVLSSLGIVLILISIGFFAYWFRDHINNYMRGASIFILGAVFLGVGELFYRKKKEIFSRIIIGGGVAIIYSGIFFSHFILKVEHMPIMNLNTALIVSVAVTIATLLLSLRYNSWEVITYALVGGYLPFVSYIFSTGFEGSAVYLAMGYLFLLNIAVLVVSFLKKWQIPNFVSFLLNVPALVYLSMASPEPGIGILYASITFLFYLIIILAYPIIYRKKLQTSDLILLGLNTFISCVVIYILFETRGIAGYRGFLALGFCAIYGALSFLVHKIMPKEKETYILFQITALTFAVLMIPFQLDKTWYTMGWIVEGILLTIVGYKKERKTLETAGWLILALCAAAFIIFDFLGLRLIIKEEAALFDLKYTLLTLTSLLFVLFYQKELKENTISEFTKKGKLINIIKHISIGNFYLYGLYMIDTYFLVLVKNSPAIESAFGGGLVLFYDLLLKGVFTLGLGIVLGKWSFIKDKVTEVFSIIAYILSAIFCLTLILFEPILEHGFTNFGANTPVAYLSIGILLVYNVLVVVYLRELILRYIRSANRSLEFYPLSMGILLMANVTAFLGAQMNLEYVSIIISFAFLILALASITYGFIKRFLYIRYFGLGLIFLSMIILFINIFNFTNIPGRIAAFFGFGVLLLGVSFIYQLINKKLEAIGQSPVTPPVKTKEESHEKNKED